MVQRDYLLREIEKIGAIFIAIKHKLFGGKENFSISVENQIENIKGMLLNEINFDLNKFLDLDIADSNEYICKFDGFSIENIENFAECIFKIGFNDNCENSKKYLEKALQLYDLCNSKSKTYSFEREKKITALKNTIIQYETS